jgi:hypothetical protein
MLQISPKAQAGLEYLMTYGWALILIATIIGVLVFVVGTPSSGITFSSSDPTKLLLKAGAVSGNTVEIKMQNATGGKINITSVTPTGYSGCELNQRGTTGINSSSPVQVLGGGEIYINCTSVTTGVKGSFSISYTDQTGLQRNASINASSATGTSGPSCGNGSCETGENCSSCPQDCGACAQLCSNNVREGTETCDGTDLAGQTCLTQGFTGGTLACAANCLSFNTSNCTSTVCGNNIKDGNEACDGTDLNGQSCESQGYSGGALACKSNCTGFDTNNCFVSVEGGCSEGDSVYLECPSGKTIVSFVSQYGNNCDQDCPVDCGYCESGASSCEVVFDNGNCGDCAGGCVKDGYLQITCR